MNVPKWTNQTINIQTLCDYVTNKSYDIEPEHQRNVVHDVFWKQSLIKSVFTNGLIPTTYWHIVTDENGRCMHENLDGKQRISTLIEYKNNKFKYNGQYYDGLSVSLQNYYIQLSTVFLCLFPSQLLDMPLKQELIHTTQEITLIFVSN